MFLIALLYYQNEKRLYYDLTKTKMQNIVSNISSEIIISHMNKNDLNLKKFLKTTSYKISFYDKNKHKILGNFDIAIDLKKSFIKRNDRFIYVANSTYGHLGISYIVVEDNFLFKNIQKLKVDIVILFLLIYSILSLIGYYLAKLFLQPMKDEREKLNNFIRDTTHELNTPISAILMSSEGDDLTKKQIHRIKLAAQKVSEVYKDLLYVFLEDKEDKSQVKMHNLKDLINTQLDYFKSLASKKHVTIDCNLENTFFEIDENDFIRLFNNIVSNSIKYNKQKGSIFIELKDRILTVKDTGIGIDKKLLKDIFKRYYRATTQSGGFGIGLNIVYQICKTYDIKIEVDSKKGEWSLFTLTFKD